MFITLLDMIVELDSGPIAQSVGLFIGLHRPQEPHDILLPPKVEENYNEQLSEVLAQAEREYGICFLPTYLKRVRYEYEQTWHVASGRSGNEWYKDNPANVDLILLQMGPLDGLPQAVAISANLDFRFTSEGNPRDYGYTYHCGYRPY